MIHLELLIFYIKDTQTHNNLYSHIFFHDHAPENIIQYITNHATTY